MLNSQRIQLYRKLLFLGFLLSTSFSQNFAIVKIADVPAKAIYLTQPKGDDSRLFVVNQKGLIYIIKNGKTVNKPFLDISDRVHGSLIPGSEEGLLGMAFHPNYFENGFFYVNYVNKNDTSIVARFSVTDNPEYADQYSELILPSKNNLGLIPEKSSVNSSILRSLIYSEAEQKKSFLLSLFTE